MQITLENHPELREATGEFAEGIKQKLSGYLEALKPSYRPAATFGQFVAVGQKETPKDAAINVSQLKDLIKAVVSAKPFQMSFTVPEQIELNFAAPQLHPFTYTHSVEIKGISRAVAVTRPLSFVMSFPEYPFSRLVELAQMKNPPADELKAFVLHYTVLHYLINRSNPVIAIFDALRFPITTERFPEFGALPIMMITPPATTVRPPDSVIANSVRQSGINAIAEVVDIAAWNEIQDPLLAQFRAAFGDIAVSSEIAA